SFTAWTTGVSNLVCSPRFRASASGNAQRPAFATGVPPDLYTFHRYTGNSSLLCIPQERQYRPTFFGWAEGFHDRLAIPPTRPLRPVIPSNACPLCLTAAAGTELAGASSEGTVRSPAYEPGIPSFAVTGVYDPTYFVHHASALRTADSHRHTCSPAHSR